MDKMDHTTRITTALLLAAGTGSRLKPITDNMPKCLTKVDEIEILGRLITCLRENSFKRLVVVVGYFDHEIRNFLDKNSGDIIVEYVVNADFATTNNIYSLWLARATIKEPFLLIESDLVFEAPLLEKMLIPDTIAVSQILPWMNGTTITTDHFATDRVASINLGANINANGNTYKTVNIYGFSLETWKRIYKHLDIWIEAGRINDYYEALFSEMVGNGSLHLQCVYFDMDRWYEIDTTDDLHNCEMLLQQSRYNLAG
ncbi:MAG TPA: phosphocholine cytidylyltransferase family protein [Flavobacteriales bacterium]|nr:phosphocholine cytidylyltransferase family protein [Flavobacteriales bacterium]